MNIVKPIEYLSYTSLEQYIACPYSFYLQRMSGSVLPQIEQTEQMAVGNAFDSYIKAAISTKIHGVENRQLFANLIKTINKENQHVIPEGVKLYEMYIKRGLLEQLYREGLADVEIDKKFTFPNGVRIYIKPDACYKDNRPHDWKVSGFKSARAFSPKPGYREYYMPEGGIKCSEDCRYMEDSNEDWAKQLCLYYWGITEDPTPRNFTGSIDQLIYTPKGLGFARYRSPISLPFQERYWNTLCDAWKNLSEGNIPLPVPNKFKCEPYRNPRPCTLTCEEYQKMLTDPVMRGIYG